MKQEPKKITEHIYGLGLGIFPMHLFLGEIGMLVEGGTGPTSGIVIDQLNRLKELGIDPKKIKYLFLTHSHFDHVGSISSIRDYIHNITVVANSNVQKAFERKNFFVHLGSTNKMISNVINEWYGTCEISPFINKEAFHVDRFVSEGDVINLGNGVELTVHMTPGHSECHSCLHEKKEGTVVLADGTGYYSHIQKFNWPNYFTSLQDYCESILKIIPIDAKRYILSHNGPIESVNNGWYLPYVLKNTVEYHNKIIRRLDGGDSPEKIVDEDAKGVMDRKPIADERTIKILCNSLIKRSMEGEQYMKRLGGRI
jgi:glyoxylase-like metal-dependent hydrolase (beta-lactamase superfamily II)